MISQIWDHLHWKARASDSAYGILNGIDPLYLNSVMYVRRGAHHGHLLSTASAILKPYARFRNSFRGLIELLHHELHREATYKPYLSRKSMTATRVSFACSSAKNISTDHF